MLRWSGILIVGYICLVFMMLYVEHRLSDSFAERHLRLTKSLQKAHMPMDQTTALLDAVDGVGRDAYGALISVFLPMGVLFPLVLAQIYEHHRRLKELGSKLLQSSPTLEPGGG